MSDLYDRAAAVLGATSDGICWPYGMGPPHPGEKRRKPDLYEQRRVRQRAKQEAQEDPRLKVVTGPGWYSPATTQIILWRADRIEDVQPATLAASEEA